MKRPARWFALALVGVWAFGCSDDATNPAEDPVDDWAPPLAVLQDLTATSTYCMEDQVEFTFGTNAVPLNCTANDVRLAATALPEGTVIECIKGEVIEDPIVLRGELIAGANERWDIGVWLALDGGDALRGNTDGTTDLGASCNHYYLEPPLSLDSYDGTGIGRGSAANGQDFYNGEPKDADDTCGDLEQGVMNILEPITLTGVVCKDEDNDGYLDIGSCVAWDNNRNGTCYAANAIAGTLPNTKSKCRCEPINVPIVVKEKGYLEVVKELVPSDDEGEFHLYIDAGTDDAVEVGPGGDGLTTGKVEVSAGTQTDPGDDHEVMEAFEEGTDSDFYDTSYECVDADTDDVLYTGTGPGPVGVHVMPEQYILCTFTNTRKPAKLIVNKVLAPSDDAGLFNLLIDDVVKATDVGDGGTTGEVLVDPFDSHTVSETAGTGTDLAFYGTVIGGDCASDGTVIVDPGETKTCTITNTRLPAKLIVEKTLAPTNDPGLFNLLIDGTAEATDVGNGGTTDEVIVTPGSHTVSETAGTDTDLDLYETVISGDCDENGLVHVDPGQTKRCRITNVRKPELKLVKRFLPNDDGGLVSFVIDEVAYDNSGSGYGHDDDTGWIKFDVGATVDFSEAGFDDTSLDDYASELYCTHGFTADPDGTAGSVPLEAGNRVTCLFTNTRKPEVRLVKEFDPITDPGSVNFTIGGVPYTNDGAGYGHGEGTGWIKFDVEDDVTFSESGFDIDLDEYDSSWQCVDQDGSLRGDEISRCGLVEDLAAGEQVTCTFTNRAKPKLTLIKIVEGGTAAPDDFMLSVIGPAPSSDVTSMTSGVTVVFDIGNYLASEVQQEGYTTDLWTGDCGVQGNVSLAYGDDKTCTITNTYMPPPVTETAYAMRDPIGICFLDEGFSQWGWTNGPISKGGGTYEWLMFAGASTCDPMTGGTYVGNVEITYAGDGTLTWEFFLKDGFSLESEHVYAGTTMFPQKDGKDTVAPGQYYIEDPLVDDIYVIIHAVVIMPAG